MAFFRRVSDRLLKGFLVIMAAGVPFAASAALGPEGKPAAETHAGVAGNHNTAAEISTANEGGMPLAGVTLSVQPRPIMMLPESLSETTVSQSDSSAKLPRPPREAVGNYFLLRKPGYETLALDASRPLPPQLRLQNGRTISGAVFTADGQPISGAIVGPVTRVDHGRTNRERQLFPRVAVRTNAAGEFSIDGMPLQAVQVQFVAPGYAPRLVTFFQAESSQKVALQSGGAIIKGRVVGSKDRAPQGGIPVEASGGGMVVYGTTDAQGTYVIDNLPTGTWTLRPAGGGPLSGTQSRAAVVEVGQAQQTLDVPLVLNQGVMLAGRAIDAETSEPLTGINITLAGYAGEGAKAVLTNGAGEFLFENLDTMQDVVIRFDPVKFVYLLPSGAYRDYFDISKVSDTDFDVTTLTVPLHRRLPLHGSVTDAAGKRVPDVEVRMQALDVVASAHTKAGRSLLTFDTKSNGDGEFMAGVYPPGRYKVWAQQDELVSQVETVDVFTTAPEPELQLKLTNAAELEGRVTDAHDAPVTAAVVIAWPVNAPEPEENPIPGRETYAYAKTGRDGKFKLTGLRGEPLMLRASHPGFFQDVKVPFDPAAAAGATSPGVTLKFPAGGEFSVTVTDDQGQPLSRAEVAVEYKEGLEGHRESVMTDRFGRAAGASLRSKQLDRVTITHPMFASFKLDGPIALPVHDYKIALKKRGSLIANVAGEGLVPGVAPELFLLKAPAGAGANAEPPGDYEFEQAGKATTVAGQAIFRSLAEGWYKVAFADSGAYAESKAVRIEPGGGDQAVDITLPKGNHLLGLVTDKESGKAIAGANVTLHPAVQSDVVAERATQNVTTQQDGSFELYNVGAGRLQVKVVVADYPDYENAVTFSPGDTLHIELSNVPATLTGQVQAGGAPVAGALLILSGGHAGSIPVATATTDESGRYSMTDFPAGSYSLAVEAPIGEGDNIARKALALQVEGGDNTKDVEFAKLVSVSGRVRLGGKAPERAGDSNGEGVTVLFRGMGAGAESKMVALDADGNYRVQLEPGDYEVSLEDGPGKPVTVGGGEAQVVDLSF